MPEKGHCICGCGTKLEKGMNVVQYGETDYRCLNSDHLIFGYGGREPGLSVIRNDFGAITQKFKKVVIE